MSNIKLHIESPTDSVLQDRMEIVHHHRSPSSKAPLALSVLVVGLLGGIGWYFYAPQAQPNATTPHVQAAAAVTPVSQPLKHADKTAEKPTVITTPVKPQPPHAPKPAEVKPVEVKSTEVQPAAPVLQTKAITPAPPIPLTSVASLGNKEELLARAKEQISRTRLTLPVGDNAYETYQALVKIAPAESAQILDAIALWHYEQGVKLAQQDKLTSPNKGNAYQLYEKMKELVPVHPDTQKLLDSILQGFEERAKKQIKANNLLTPEKNSAYNTCKEIAQLAPDHKTTKSCLNQIANELLNKAKKQLADKLYLTPANNNVFDTYQKILKIVPDHPQAQAGLKSLAREYYKLALKTKNEKRVEVSKDMVEKGLQINPQDTKLLELKKQLDNLKR
jgi:hypothetical protein